MSTVTTAIRSIGLTAIGRKLGLYPSAIQKWRDDGRLPRSDLAGLTKYAETISQLSRSTEDPVTVDQLLSDTRRAWEAKPAGKSGGQRKIRPKRLESRTS